MFYLISSEATYRFGDVIQGYALAETEINQPTSLTDYSISVQHPQYSVILTPCCSIENQTILLSPLIQLKQSFFNNPFFVEDFTRINRKMPVEKMVPPAAWPKIPLKKQQEMLEKGNALAFYDLFIYEKHDLLPSYEINLKGQDNLMTNHYMISFKNCFKINCAQISRSKNIPEGTKVLQLSIDARNQLRDKLTYFYSRVPDEDKE